MNKFIKMKSIVIIFFILLFACQKKLDSTQNIHERVKISYPAVETIRLPQTGQTRCYDDTSDIIPCTGTGQDGELKRGAVWPKPRYIVNSNGTITDRLTGLMWERVPLKKPVNWEESFKRIRELNTQRFAGYRDWRLPNINELSSLINFGVSRQYIWLKSQGFDVFQGQLSQFWSSTTDHIKSIKDNSPDKYAYVLDIYDGSIGSGGKSGKVSIIATNLYVLSFVIGVRTAGQGVIKLPRTGQTKKYHVGDDGDLQMGVPIPKPRFIDNRNDTMTDRLTGLMWEKKPSDKNFNWNDAFNRIKELNLNRFAGYNDWRLPNIIELLSFINYEIPLRDMLKNGGFEIPSKKHLFWSCTTEIDRIGDYNLDGYSAKSGFAWLIFNTDGKIFSSEKLLLRPYIGVIAVCGGS